MRLVESRYYSSDHGPGHCVAVCGWCVCVCVRCVCVGGGEGGGAEIVQPPSYFNDGWNYVYTCNSNLNGSNSSTHHEESL